MLSESLALSMVVALMFDLMLKNLPVPSRRPPHLLPPSSHFAGSFQAKAYYSFFRLFDTIPIFT